MRKKMFWVGRECAFEAGGTARMSIGMAAENGFSSFVNIQGPRSRILAEILERKVGTRF